MGEQSVKNFSKPVRVYAVGPEGPARRGDEPLGLRDKPAIVVLPFANMSDDAEQEFFADGLTEDIITELSRFRDLLVISRNTSSRYKGKAVDVKQVARELSVHYLVEGSVRKAGNRVRVTVQLIDAESDRHVWADKFDRELADIFAIQDEVTSSIVATLPRRVEAAMRDRAAVKPTESMAAYECVLAGKLRHHRSTREDNVVALGLLKRAVELDPNYAHAHAWYACTLGQAWVNGFTEDRDATWNQMNEELRTALALDDNDSDVHRILSAMNLNKDDLEKAAYHQERALALNPNDDLVVVQQGEILTWQGQGEEGAEWIRKAMRLNPYHPERFWSHLGRAHFVARRYAEAVEALKKLSTPDHIQHASLAACYAQLDNPAEAKSHIDQALKRQPPTPRRCTTNARRIWPTTVTACSRRDCQRESAAMITADLKGKSALVIGGTSGIGLATVERLTACEARVTIDDLPGEKLGRKVARLHRLGREALACPGGIDNLVNDGGTPGTATPISHLTAAEDRPAAAKGSRRRIAGFRASRP